MKIQRFEKSIDHAVNKVHNRLNRGTCPWGRHETESFPISNASSCFALAATHGSNAWPLCLRLDKACKASCLITSSTSDVYALATF